MNKTHIVVGGAGFIGSYLVDALLQQGDKVIVIDNLFSGSLDNLVEAKKSSNFRFVGVDIQQIGAILEEINNDKIDTLFNLATAGLLRSLDNPSWCCMQELSIAQSCCTLLQMGIVNKLVHFSSSEVYGKCADLYLEDISDRLPTTAYAVGKLAADNYLKVMMDLYKINAVIIRPFNNFGYRQRNFEYQGIIPRAIRLFNNKQPFIINGNGEQKRDFIYVDDMLKRLFMILEYHFNSTDPFKYNVYQICSGNAIRVIDLLRNIAHIGNFSCNIIYGEERPGDISRLCGIETGICKAYPSLTPLDESIAFLIKKEKEQCG